MVRKQRRVGPSLSGEFLEQSLSLPISEAAQTSIVCDAERLHESYRFDLPHPGHRCDEPFDFEPVDEVVFRGPGEQLCYRHRSGLEELFDFSTDPTCFCRPLQSSLSLLWCEFRWVGQGIYSRSSSCFDDSPLSNRFAAQTAVSASCLDISRAALTGSVAAVIALPTTM